MVMVLRGIIVIGINRIIKMKFLFRKWKVLVVMLYVVCTYIVVWLM